MNIIKLSDIVYAEAGPNHSFIIKGDNSLWSWGKNDYGDFGDGERKEKLCESTTIQILKDITIIQK